MNQELIEKYRNEMLKMYNAQRTRPAENEMGPEVPQTPPEREMPQPTIPAEQNSSPQDSTGRLIAIVTTVRSLYPVYNAKVTVFTGDAENMQVLATAFTDQSGRTEEFVLNTPSKQLSQQSQNTVLPYALYNMMVEADGYIDNIHLNIPVFSETTSLQRSNMMLYETAGEDKGPRIFDELQQFDL